MAARRADQASGRIGLQPAFTLSAIPDPVLGTEHPTAPLAIQHGQVAHRDPEGSRLQSSDAALFYQVSITELGFGEWIDSHPESIARDGC